MADLSSSGDEKNRYSEEPQGDQVEVAGERQAEGESSFAHDEVVHYSSEISLCSEDLEVRQLVCCAGAMGQRTGLGISLALSVHPETPEKSKTCSPQFFFQKLEGHVRLIFTPILGFACQLP